MVKAQVLAGGRGKRGGISHRNDTDRLAQQAAKLHGAMLGERAIHAVLIEQKLQIEREYYLAVFVNSDLGQISVMMQLRRAAWTSRRFRSHVS